MDGRSDASLWACAFQDARKRQPQQTGLLLLDSCVGKLGEIEH